MRSLQLRVVPFLTTVLRLGLGIMLLYSGLVKARHPYQFLSNVYDYELVGPEVGKVVAIGLPSLELLIGGCLIGGIYVPGALMGSMLLGAMFTFATASSLYRGLSIACGCFGASVDVVTGFTVARAGGVCLASLLALLGTRVRGRQAQTPADDPPGANVSQLTNLVEGAL
ncbi:MAG: MauE/DoxX family redox-associated membrane protein [Bacillota bacterium]